MPKNRLKPLRAQFFDPSYARIERARHARSILHRLDIRDRILGLAVFIMATGERPTLENARDGFLSEPPRQRTNTSPRRVRADLSELL